MSTLANEETDVGVYNPAIEHLSRERVLELQWRKLAFQLDHLFANNPFYAERFRAAGVKSGDITSLQAFTEAIPFCDKQDLLADQLAHPPYGLRLGVREDQVAMPFLTSGTSGIGQEAYGHTWSDALLAGTKYLEGPLWWAGLRKGDRIFAMAPVATLAFGLMVQETLRLAGYQPFQTFVMDSAAKLQMMQRFPPAAIVATPAHLARLSSVAREMGIAPRDAFPTLKGLFVAGQAYPAELGPRLEELWGTKLYETYGSSQGNGHMAATCELGAVRPDGGRGALHIYEHRVLLEVIDPDTGEHVAPGEEGMAVITTFEIEGSPLVRFRTNDRARYLGHECSCGRPWAMIEAGSIGRYDDMVKVRGMNIWPQVVDDVVFAGGLVDEYVATISVDDGGLEQIDLTYALLDSTAAQMSEDARRDLAAGLVKQLKAKTNVTFKVREVARTDLPVFEFKAVRWHDRRTSDLAKKVW
ncbi:MAG TPA: AMP-binding protein [Acidimicrobiales bacterium]|nr:AMP-binding protein [Acidimicrobiales bacterium]